MPLKIPESLTEQTFRLIRSEILRGKLSSGQRLTEEFFATRFGISKSPIREALNRLEAEGLIRIFPRRGAFVIDLTVQDIEEIYEMREILEARMVRGVKLDRKIRTQLHRTLELAEKHLHANDKQRYMRQDAAFHTILADANPNSRLRTTLQRMHNQMMILRQRTFELSGRSSTAAHGRILHALENEDQEMAERLMVEHIRSVRDQLLVNFSERQGERRKLVFAGKADSTHQIVSESGL